MEQRTVGKSNIKVGGVGLGLMSMSGVYGKPDDAQSIRVIQRALDLGVTFLDSSDMYGWGQNEQLLGRALAGRRDRALLSVKFGALRAPDGSFTGYDARPAAVKNFLAHSLAYSNANGPPRVEYLPVTITRWPPAERVYG